MKRINYHILFLAGVLSLGLLFSSCKKFVTVDPPNNQLATATVFTEEATATAAVLNIYGSIYDSWRIGGGGMSLFPGFSADELVSYTTEATTRIAWSEFVANALRPDNIELTNKIWGNAYSQLYAANSVIEGLVNSVNIRESIKAQLTGEAKFMRAFFHFYLVNLFGETPLVTTTDYRVTSTISRAAVDKVYNQIVQDLLDAVQLLPSDYVSATNGASTERVRPVKHAARALLSRVYLYTGNWSKAEEYAGLVISETSKYQLETDLNNVFLKNRQEAIWQLMPINGAASNTSTVEGYYLITLSGVPQHAALTDNLFNAFEAGDQRKAKWISSVTSGTTTYYFPYKYKVKQPATAGAHTEYVMAFRLAEQYLIRAEARAQLNNISGTQADLNAIRNRAGLANTTAADKTTLLAAIESERRAEFFVEWGHRWFDLKRWNRANAVLGPVKGSAWQPTDVLYPIPQVQITADPNCTQNPGY